MNKRKIKDLFLETKSLSKTAKILNISRQRINQVINEYSNTGKSKTRSLAVRKLYENLDSCEDCGEKVNLLHHIDFNNKNDEVLNLAKLCKKCHIKRHVKYRKDIAYIISNKKFNNKITFIKYPPFYSKNMIKNILINKIKKGIIMRFKPYKSKRYIEIAI